ncbi:MAG: putative DNA-binding protein [Nitrospiraceae bacterium]|nr:MAG: putative DNA-binding protein [Nitrospiraceae bacterium]
MAKRIEWVAMLYDFYGSLLTDKQQEILSLYYEQDLSLGEIADEFSISRQAVHDILKRSEGILEGYEEKLGLVKKYRSEKEKLDRVLLLVDGLDDSIQIKAGIKEILNEIVKLQHDDYDGGGHNSDI